MRIRFSERLMEDMKRTIDLALSKGRIVNLTLLAEQIRRRNEIENVALEDITEQLMMQAQALGALMEFDRERLT